MTKPQAGQPTPIPTGLTSGSNVALGGDGYAYVVGYGNNALYKVNLKTGANGGGPLAKVNGSRGVAVGADGLIYVLSFTDKCLYQVSADGTVKTPPLATGLGGVHSVALDGDGNAYVTNHSGELWRVPLHGGQPERTAKDLGDIWGVALDGKGYAYITNAVNGSLYKVDLSNGKYGAPLTTKLGRATGVTLDAVGNAYVTSAKTGLLCRVSTDGTEPDPPIDTIATGLPDPQEVAMDGEGNAYVISGTGVLWRVASAAASAPVSAPTITAPQPDAHTSAYPKFSGFAPGARLIIVQNPDGTKIGSQTVRADNGYWAWARGEDVVGLASELKRGLPWSGTNTIQFVAHNDLGYSAPTPITFTAPDSH